MTNDPRYIALRKGLEQLTNDQLLRIVHAPNERMVCDTFAYDAAEDKW